MVLKSSALGAVCMLLFASVATAQDFEMRPPEDPGAGPEIIGGRPSVPGNWPATLYFTTVAGACTSTIIGPQVILTAAHCVQDGGTGQVTIGGAAQSVTCDHHPGYAGDYRLDLALCAVGAPIALRRGGFFETLNRDETFPPVGDEVLIQGFGCRQVGGGGPAGILWEGDTTVVQAAVDGPYIVTAGGAAVCFGDSGGAAFSDADERRVVIGVNSRGDIATRSSLSAVAFPEIRRFVTDWAIRKSLTICGVTPELNGCRE